MNETEYFEPSTVGSDYNRYIAAMKPALAIPHNKSFQVVGEFKLEFLRNIAINIGVRFEGVKVVVIQHSETVFEVRRISDVGSIDDFYTLIEKPKQFLKSSVEQFEAVRQLIEEFPNLDISEMSVYEPNFERLFVKRCFSQRFVYRKLRGLKAFRGSDSGVGQAIRNALLKACNDGMIEELASDEALELVGNNAAVFRIK